MTSMPFGIAVVGYGNWGPRMARNFERAEDAELRVIVDLSEAALREARKQNPGVKTTSDFDEALLDDKVSGIYIATPVGTHAHLVKRALEAGKDVLVEKPLTASIETAKECAEMADHLGRILMVGHTFVYSPPVRRIRELVRGGELGRVLYIESSRVNLGLFQKDVSVIWDLAPHDLSIILYATERKPIAVAAHGKSFFGAKNLQDVAVLSVEFDNGMLAYLQLSWLAPVKLRRTTFIGDRKMIVYDDSETVEKVKIYDRGVDAPVVTPMFGEFQLTYRFGDVVSPFVSNREPLAIEADAFVAAIRTRQSPESDGRFGVEIVAVLEAATRSMEQGGAFVRI